MTRRDPRARRLRTAGTLLLLPAGAVAAFTTAMLFGSGWEVLPVHIGFATVAALISLLALVCRWSAFGMDWRTDQRAIEAARQAAATVPFRPTPIAAPTPPPAPEPRPEPVVRTSGPLPLRPELATRPARRPAPAQPQQPTQPATPSYSP